jgi:hypothetical protein
MPGKSSLLSSPRRIPRPILQRSAYFPGRKSPSGAMWCPLIRRARRPASTAHPDYRAARRLGDLEPPDRSQFLGDVCVTLAGLSQNSGGGYLGIAWAPHFLKALRRDIEASPTKLFRPSISHLLAVHPRHERSAEIRLDENQPLSC